MWIRSVTAHAFGPLSGQTLELASGLTVISGINESAKSSWHAAVYAALCGRRRSKGALSREDRRYAELHRPWDGGGWEVSCVLELADGRVIELRHDLDGRVDCRAIDRLTGADVSREIITDGSPDGARWLGLDRRSFGATASVTQTELLAVLGAAVGWESHLQRAAATAGTADGTASLALERLDRCVREQIGTDRAGSTKPLRRALDGLGSAQRGLAAAREQHDAYLSAEMVARSARAEAERAEASAADAARRQAALQRASGPQAEADMLRSAVETAEDRVLESAQAVSALRHRYDEAEQLQQSISEAQLAGERSLASVSAQQFSDADARELALAADQLPPGPGGDVSVSVDVAALANDFELALAVARRHRDSCPAEVRIADRTTAAAVRVGPSALRDLAARVDALTALIGDSAGEVLATDPPQRLTVRRIGLLACAALALVGIVLAGSGEVLPGVVLLGVAGGAAVWASRRRSAMSVSAQVPAGLAPAQQDAARGQLRAVADRCRRLGVPPAAEELRRWAGHAERIADQEQEWLRWELDGQEHETRVRDLGKRLCALIAERDPAAVTEHSGDPARCLASYRQRCSERAADQVRTVHRADLQRARLEVLLDGGGLEQLHGRLLAAQGHHRELVRHAAEQTEALENSRAAAVEALIDGGILAEEAVAVVDGSGGSGTDPAIGGSQRAAGGPELAALLNAASQEVARTRAQARAVLDEAGRCEGAAHQHASTVPSVAEAEERLAAAEAELSRVREAQRTLTLTRDFLSRAQQRVHRDIAPVLARTLTERLPEVTAGRYVEALVDPATLQIQVCGPDGRWRTADRLSVGTAEQIYLLLRIALAAHLCAPGETCPLLLDDVTVQADTERTVAILEMLLAEAAGRQIVLFAQEPLVADWAAERLAGADRHAVVGLPAPA
jgi:hypothetical protein